MAAALAIAPLQAQSTESGVKAAFIPKFARYVEWPAAMRPAPGQPYQLCVIGHDSFGPLLDRAAEAEQIDGRGVALRRLADPENSAACHVAFVRGANPEETARVLRRAVTVVPQPGAIPPTAVPEEIRRVQDRLAEALEGIPPVQPPVIRAARPEMVRVRHRSGTVL